MNKLLLNSDYVELYVKSVTYNLRVSHVTMYIIVVLQIRCVGVFVVYIHTRFHLHSSNVLLFTVIKPNTKDVFTWWPCCYFTLSKNITYTEVFFQNLQNAQHFKSLK